MASAQNKIEDVQDDGDSLVARMEADLVAGRFHPGQWLKQADIEATYGANRFDVRMALIDLKVRKLIEHVRNRGFRVVNLTSVEREQLLETRTILETAAARLAARNATPASIAELRDIVERFGKGIETAALDELRTLNARFHDTLYGACGNAVLAGEIAALRQRGVPGSNEDGGVWRTVGGLTRSHDEHCQMVDLLERRDGEGLADAVDRHINHWRELFSTRAETSI